MKPKAMGYVKPKSIGTNTVGEDVGLVGWLEGAGEGAVVGRDVGRLVGTLVGRLDEGIEVGLLVSPGLVGREVTGADVGAEVGDPLVGIEVGACTIIGFPTTTDASRIEAIEDFASGVNSKDTFNEEAALSS